MLLNRAAYQGCGHQRGDYVTFHISPLNGQLSLPIVLLFAVSVTPGIVVEVYAHA